MINYLLININKYKMDELPGNPWIYDKKEKKLEELRIRRIEIYLQWKSAESAIKYIVNKNDVWDMCDKNTKFIFNHKTNRFIQYNKYNKVRIQKSPHFIDYIYLEFNSTTGWYNYEKHIHIPDKALYHLYNSKDNLIIEFSQRKRFTYDWENTIEEKLEKQIKNLEADIIHLNHKLINSNLLTNLLCKENQVRVERNKDIKNILNNQLIIIDNISEKIPEGDYLNLMNYLKEINNKLTIKDCVN